MAIKTFEQISDDEAMAKNHGAIAKVKSSIDVGMALREHGLLRFYDPENALGGVPGYVLYIESVDDIKDMAALLHSIFKDIKRSGTVDMWCPYGNVVIVSWNYLVSSVLIKVWLETDIKHAPTYLAGGHCGFVEENKSSHRLVCGIKE